MMIVVTIPAYNEEKTIGALVGNIHKVMKEKRYSYKILVLDDGSSDKTAKAAKSAKAVVYSHADVNCAWAGGAKLKHIVY